jgi:hypothetical protein
MDKHLIKVIDNFVNPTYSDALLNDAKHYLQYCYIEKTTRPDAAGPEYDAGVADENTYDAGQMVCPLYDGQVPFGTLKFDNYMMFVKPLMFNIIDTCAEFPVVSPMRIKVNLLLKQPTFPADHYNLVHVDNIHEDKWSAVYYLNDSDGDTVLFNEFREELPPTKLTIFKRISPKKNRLVVFNSSRYHASCNPSINTERFIINFVMDTK